MNQFDEFILGIAKIILVGVSLAFLAWVSLKIVDVLTEVLRVYAAIVDYFWHRKAYKAWRKKKDDP